ncbi:MAG: hypothetical protein AAGF75_03935 [Cyanobacteria bacterium P01_H01_bin.130]
MVRSETWLIMETLRWQSKSGERGDRTRARRCPGVKEPAAIGFELDWF